MEARTPDVIVLAGPNGAGKSTTAPALLRGLLDIRHYVNADLLAQGLSGFAPEAAAFDAGRIMLDRLHELGRLRTSFAFETTLASRSYASWLKELIESGYRFHLIFLWLSSATLAVERVAQRVRMGGHDVPEATIRRRYRAGLRNLFELYQPLASVWRVYDNSGEGAARLIAVGQRNSSIHVVDRKIWSRIKRSM